MLLCIEVQLCGCPVVKHRAEKPLRHRMRGLAVAHSLREGCGKAAAGALPADRDSPRIDTERPGIPRQPFPRRVTVVNGRRIGVPRGQGGYGGSPEGPLPSTHAAR